MSNIIHTANNAKKIIAYENQPYCSKCNKRQYSPFDKLFLDAYGECFMCCDTDDMRKGENILRIVETAL